MVCYCKKFFVKKFVWEYIPAMFFVLYFILIPTTVFAAKGRDGNNASVINPIGNQQVNEGDVVSISPTGTDPDGDVSSYSYSGWITPSNNTTVSGDAGVHIVDARVHASTVTARDGALSVSHVTVTEGALTATVTLSWEANTEPDLEGYKIYYGTASRVYPNVIDVGNVASFTLTIEAGVDIYAALTAYDISGNESGYSSELVFNSSEGTAGSPPVLTPIGNKQTSEGQELSFTISATDADGDTLHFTAGNLPSGASFDEINRIFSWIPGFDQSGTHTEVSFSVS